MVVLRWLLLKGLAAAAGQGSSSGSARPE